jgi:hypothetical protein
MTSRAFCEGKEFTGDALLRWSHRLKQSQARFAEAELRVARVLRAPAERVASPSPTGAIELHLGPARVSVQPGFDRVTLTALVEALAPLARVAE